MNDTAAGLDLVERTLEHGRMQLALVDHEAPDGPVDACELTIDPLELHDGGGGLVRVDGIGNVATRETHRRRGLATALLHAAIGRMRERGVAGSLLYGIDDFYVPLGWVSWGDERWVRIRLGAIDPAWSTGYEVRPMRDADRAPIAAAYERVAAATPGAASRRGGRVWSQLRKSEAIVVERDGELRGWAWRGAGDVAERDTVAQRNPGSLAYAELHALDDDAALAVLAGVREHEPGIADDVELLTGACEGHPLRTLARADRFAATLVDEVRPTGGAMLLAFNEQATTSLRGATPYQFLPDRF